MELFKGFTNFLAYTFILFERKKNPGAIKLKQSELSKLYKDHSKEEISELLLDSVSPEIHPSHSIERQFRLPFKGRLRN